MAGTVRGGKKAAETNKKFHGDDFYKKIGAIGGRNGHTGGFAYSKAHGLTTHIEAGRKGGKISRKPKQNILDKGFGVLLPPFQKNLLRRQGSKANEDRR